MPEPGRDEIIETLRASLGEQEFVLAAWLEGADAHGEVDQYSDIDLWLDVADGRVDEALTVVRDCLERLGPLELATEVEHPHPLIRQAFFQLRGAPEYLLLDLCIQEHERQFVFTEGDAGGQVLVLFDEAGVVRFQAKDEEALVADLETRLARLERASLVYPRLVNKEIARGSFLDALGAYQRYLLEPLVEALRLRYTPTKAEFHLKHASRDLPEEAVESLEWLFAVRDVGEIAERLPEATDLLRRTLAGVRSPPG